MRSPEPGLEIDGFTIGQMLHRGGFATIWAVTHPAHPEAMVMKVPTIHDGYDAPTIVGFEVEQMIMPRLTGPHVPRVFGTGDFSVMPYIVTERIHGGSLAARFQSAPLPLEDVMSFGARLATAVKALHLQHVAHLDLKPDNVLQRPTGEMVLIDYGLARHERLPDLLAEEFPIPMGSYPYIAPEQVLRQRDDPRADLFALGAMLYQAATGRAPFGLPQTRDQLRRRLWRDPDPPRALRPDLPEGLQEIILRALEVSPESRYQSAEDLARDLAQPEAMALSQRGHKRARDPWPMVLKRRWQMRKVDRLAPPQLPKPQVDRPPVLLVAIDLSPTGERLHAPLMDWLRRFLQLTPGARVAVVNVIRNAVLGVDLPVEPTGDSLHVDRLLRLKAWAKGLDLPEAQLTFTVLESADPGQSIVEHAAAIHADHLLMGARGASPARRYLGSVSSKVVAQAGCTVTVVRQPANAMPPDRTAP